MWGLGYGSSADEEDEVEEQETEEDAKATQTVADKLFKQQFESITDEDKELIYESTRLRSVYSQRWWQYDLKGTYFVMYNMKHEPIRKGEQLTYSYGAQGNASLIEK